MMMARKNTPLGKRWTALPPSLPLAVLRARYEAEQVRLVPTGMGTLLDRYLDFEGFLEHGPWLAALHRSGWDTEPVATLYPGLIGLALEAWPTARAGASPGQVGS